MQTIAVTDEIRAGHAALAVAVEFACRYHVAQVRKGGGVPYVSHLLQVAGLVLEYGGSYASAVAAVLHDVVEDTTATLSIVRDAFGDEVADIVAACTDTASEASGVDKEPWRVRKERHLAKLTTSAPCPCDTEHDRTWPDPICPTCKGSGHKGLSVNAAVVIACDKLHNLSTQISDLMHGGETVKFNASLADRAWLNASTYLALRDVLPAQLENDLETAVLRWLGVSGSGFEDIASAAGEGDA